MDWNVLQGNERAHRAPTFYSGASETSTSLPILENVEGGDVSSSPETSLDPSANCPSDISADKSPVNEAIRPVNLPLFESETKSLKLKQIVKKQLKRDTRLLSVPNIKYQKNEVPGMDRRHEEASATADPNPGNPIKRYSELKIIFFIFIITS